MLLFILAFFGGALTIASPCILPVLPFVFARADQPFWKSGLPMLGGMALTFAAVATLASVGGGWAVQANEYGRYAALVLLGIFAVTLLSPQLAELVSRPFVRLGNRMTNTTISTQGNVAQSIVLGIATGLLWAPCAGPILGLILTGAALGGAHVGTSILLLAYACGAGVSLAVVLTAGNRIFNRLKRSLGVEEWIRRGLGVLVLAAVVVIAFGLDRGFLTNVSLGSTTNLEQGLIAHIMPGAHKAGKTATDTTGLSDYGPAPQLSGAVAWINSPPLTPGALRGKAVLIDFWTYSCINCLRSLPYVKAWAQKYTSDGLVVIGIHTPEFAFEKEKPNVLQAVHNLGVTYPVAMDNNYVIWNAFKNEYWPAHYLIDKAGNIRYEHFGEGSYDETERAIQTVLGMHGAVSAVTAHGVEAASDESDVKTPETYLGYERAASFASGNAVYNQTAAYAIPSKLRLNQWALHGEWQIGEQTIVGMKSGSAIALRFHARDAHIVLGPTAGGKPVRFRVLLDGHAPGEDAGVDIDANGYGIVRLNRLYQIIRQHGAIHDATLTIVFLDPGVQAYSFTFG